MFLKILTILIILSPFCDGITYLFVSNHHSIPYMNLAKFKEEDPEKYKYKNKQAGILYTVLGFIIGLFLLLFFWCFDLFDSSSILLVTLLLITILEQIVFDAILNIKFQMKNLE